MTIVNLHLHRLKGLKQEDILIYRLIEQAGNMGIWQKDLKNKSRLQTRQINKHIKTLISRKLIKTVKTIHGKNKKVYMLADLEPSREITGGAWYNEKNELNKELIVALQDATLQFIVQKKFASTDNILDHIRSQGISSEVDLKRDDIQSIIDTLVYDGLIEEVPDLKQSKQFYKPCGTITPENAFTDIPCSTCPVGIVNCTHF